MAGQVHRELFSQEGGITFGEFVSVADESGAGDDFPGGVLEARQPKTVHLRPVLRNILQILGIDRELAKEFPVLFNRAQLFFSDVLFLAWAHQLVLADNAGNGIVAAAELEFLFKPLSAKASLFAQTHDGALQGTGGLVRTMFRASGLFEQGGRLAWHMTTQPFAYGVARTTQLAGGGLDALSAGQGHDLLMKPMAIRTHTVEFEVGQRMLWHELMMP